MGYQELTGAHLAVEYGQQESLRIINELAPETLYMKDRAGLTPVHYAALSGNVPLLHLLQDKVKHCFSMKDNHGRVPADYADSLEVRQVLMGFK